MKSKHTKLYSLVLTVLLCLTTILANNNVCSAAEPEYTNLFEEYGTATANTENSYNFTVNMNTNVFLYVYVPIETDCCIAIYTSSGDLYGSKNISSYDFSWSDQSSVYYYDYGCSNMPSGDYTAKITFDTDTEYIFGVDVEKILATISDSSATISVGFTKKLKVDNTKEKVTWSSSKKSVATVSSKGVVTAKKAGTTTITAKTKSGQKLTCKITVKANTYKETKISAKNLYYGKCILQAYNASYNSKGDLVVKCRIANNSGYKIVSLKNLKLTFKTDTGKTIGTCSIKSKKVSIAHGATKDFTLTIKKSQLKIKKADLRNATYTPSGTYEYYY